MSLAPGGLKTKDPDAIRNGQFDLSAFLGTALLVGQSVVASGGDAALLIDSVGPDATSQKVNYRISAGTVGRIYRVRCRFSTDENPQQVQDVTIFVLVQEG